MSIAQRSDSCSHTDDQGSNLRSGHPNHPTLPLKNLVLASSRELLQYFVANDSDTLFDRVCYGTCRKIIQGKPD